MMTGPFAPLIDAIAEAVVAKLASTTHRMVSQHGSPLGPRIHRKAVKRRLERGLPGAAISPDGRRFMLTHEALAEELAGDKRAAEPDVALDDWQREVVGGLRKLREVR